MKTWATMFALLVAILFSAPALSFADDKGDTSETKTASQSTTETGRNESGNEKEGSNKDDIRVAAPAEGERL